MKTISQNRLIFLISCLAILFTTFQSANARSGGARPGEIRPDVNISFETFYHELSPYGSWVNDRNFGHVWIPDVPRGFSPYMTEGHWVMTEYGNTWVSNYTWGWAPFHYGRWHLDDYYGWMWVPGTEWGPAWVAWRNGGGYYGWAPLGPGININVSVNIGRHIPNSYWAFVRYGHFTRHNVYRYCAPRRQVTNIINHTTIINNTYVDNGRHTYYTGPRVHDIERTTQKRVQVHSIRHIDRPGTTMVRNGAVNVYRPSVRNNRNTAAARREADHQNTRSNVTEYQRNNAVSRSREQYTKGRQSIDNRNARSTRNYAAPATAPNSRNSIDNNSRANRTYESPRESRTYRSNSESRPNTNTQLQRSSRSSTPQSYGTRENTSSRSRSSNIERSSPTKSSGQSTRPGRGNNTYQREQRSSSAARSNASRSTERSTQGRSSRSSRSGGN